ncbi:MAG TPA: BamA/TamA family outer membrane protein [bacterium]|jgi:outer membrane protein insertion porin family
MTNKLRLIAILLALLVMSSAAWAVLTLAEYDQWQAYDGLYISSIKFGGLHTLTRSDLLNVMATEPSSWLRRFFPFGHRTQFYADDFAGDLFRVEHFYNRQGFLHAKVTGTVTTDNKRQKAYLKLDIDEGPPLILTHWDMVRGSDSAAYVDSARWSKAIVIKPGKRLTLPDVQTSADTFAYKMKDFGYARAHVTYQIDRDSVNNLAHVTFTIFPGHYCHLGTTRFVGLKQFAEESARRELDYKEGDPYAVHKLELTRERLVNLQVFTFVTVRADTGVPGDVLPVTVQVEEGRRYHVSGGVGYDTQQRERLTAQFRDLNFFGRARRFQLDGTYARLQRTAEIQFFVPHEPVHVTDITINPKWDWEAQPDLHKEIVSNTVIFSATPLRYVTTAVSNEFGTERVRDIDTTTHIAAQKIRTQYLRSVETASVSWDTRDNPLSPRKGHLLSLTMSESGLFYGTEVRWWRVIAQASGLLPRGRFTVLAARAKFGVMGPLATTPVTPPEESFRLGGAGDVRGWVYQKLAPPNGGNLSFNITAEVRRNILGPVVAATFIDAGNVWTSVNRWRLANLYPSAGVGLMLITPVGPLRVDYAHQLRKNPYGGATSAVDLSVGATF